MSRTVALVFGLLFSLQAQAADDPLSALKSFGFSGRWAVRCDRPAALDNSVREIAGESGEIHFTETLGENVQPNEYEVLGAELHKARTIVLRIELNGNVEQELTIVRRSNTMRTMANRRLSDGVYVVKGGTILATGKPTPAMTRCSKAARD